MPLVNMRDLVNFSRVRHLAVPTINIQKLEDLLSSIRVAHDHELALILCFPLSATETTLPLMSVAHKLAEDCRVPVALLATELQTYAQAVEAIAHGAQGIVLRNKQNDARLTTQFLSLSSDCGVAVGLHLGLQDNNTQPECEEYNDKFDFLKPDSSDYFTNAKTTTALTVNPKPLLKCLDENDSVTPLNTNKAGDIFLHQSINEFINNCTQHTQVMNAKITISEILEQCQAWRPVEHLIIFNVAGTSDQQAQDMMQKGKAVLATIPGVMRVDIGSALTEKAKYQYTWLVRFCHPRVIDSYREHPAHVEFANTLFRPVAGDRISIDYRIL